MIQILHIGVARQHRVYKVYKAYKGYKVYRVSKVLVLHGVVFGAQ